MKRFWFMALLTLLCLVMALAISCGNDDDDNDDSGDDDVATDDDTGDDDQPTDNVWIDPETGLMWQVDPPAKDKMNWFQAGEYCEGLALGGFTDWRTPTISELRSLIRGCIDTQSDGQCGVTDDCVESTCLLDACRGCTSGTGAVEGCYWPPELTGECSRSFWTSSTVTNVDYLAWYIVFDRALIFNVVKDHNRYSSTRCVR